jgi:hypothetical protein
MRRMTQELVEIALEHGGSFYLPYRLHHEPNFGGRVSCIRRLL